MLNKKTGYFIVASLMLFFSLSLIAADLDIKKETISNVAIKDLNKPAIFSLELTNLGEGDIFNIYSIAGVNMEPNESFSLDTGATKKLTVYAYPTIPLKVSPDYYSFEYKIKGMKAGIQKDQLAIEIVNLKDAFNFNVDPINPDSTTATITLENKYGGDLNNVVFEISSVFFSLNQNLSFTAHEKKEISLDLNDQKVRESLAGPYIVNALISLEGISGTTSTILKYEEKSGIETTENKEGFLSKRYEVEKANKGNVKTSVEVVATKNLFASLFTSVNPSATKKDISKFHITYIFQKELNPGESLKVVVKTNWWILIGIIIVIIIIYYIIDEYIRNKLVLKKRISLVRTKGGEFALRVSITAKARDFVERIRIIDRLPLMVKFFEKYGLPPDKIDEKSRRVEWDIQALSKGEERIFNYIIYSKVGVVGKFELPQAEAIYEFKGKIKEASSNRAFLVNEPNARSSE